MCAKVSKKTTKATDASPTPGGSRTPQRNTRQTPSKVASKAGSKAAAKTPAKGKSGRSGKQQNRSSQSDDDESDDQADEQSEEQSGEQSENESDNQSDQGDTGVYDTYEQARRRVYNSDDDFLGRPASQTESNVTSEETNGSVDQRPSQSSQTPSTGRRPPRKQVKPKKKRPSQTPVIKEIIKLQNSTKLLIPKLSFQRVVREVLQECKQGFRVQSSSLACLQEAAEHYLTQLFEDAHLCCLHRQRVTLNEKDLRLVSLLRGPVEAGRR